MIVFVSTLKEIWESLVTTNLWAGLATHTRNARSDLDSTFHSVHQIAVANLNVRAYIEFIERKEAEMQKPIYALIKDNEWGDTVWLIVAPGSSPFGRYPTQALAKKDAKEYGLKIERRANLDAPSAGRKGY